MKPRGVALSRVPVSPVLSPMRVTAPEGPAGVDRLDEHDDDDDDDESSPLSSEDDAEVGPMILGQIRDAGHGHGHGHGH